MPEVVLNSSASHRSRLALTKKGEQPELGMPNVLEGDQE